jgi:hypothetical protein
MKYLTRKFAVDSICYRKRPQIRLSAPEVFLIKLPGLMANQL